MLCGWTGGRETQIRGVDKNKKKLWVLVAMPISLVCYSKNMEVLVYPLVYTLACATECPVLYIIHNMHGLIITYLGDLVIED